MGLVTIIDLYYAILCFSQRARQANKDFDGQVFWQSIKGELGKTKFQGKWKEIPQMHFDELMSLPEFYINGHGDKKIIEVNHFVIQTVRIPRNDPPSLRKMIQVALNVGQYIGIVDVSKLTKDQISIHYYLSDDTIRTELLTIMDDAIIKSLETKLKIADTDIHPIKC
jgi:hypothetical protein